MATSDGGGGSAGRGDRAWAYLTSTRHLVAGGSSVVVGVGTFLLQAPTALPPLLAVGSYIATVTLWPQRPRDEDPPDPQEPPGPPGPPGPDPVPGPPGSPSARIGFNPLPPPAHGRTGLGPARAGAAGPPRPPAAPEGAPAAAAPRLWPRLEELAAFVGSAPLPPSSNVPGLLVRLRTAGPGPTTEPIVHRRLPLAVDGYLRALTWQPWVPDGADPAAELARAVDEMAALVPAS
ncbi:hypothetical protein ABTX81_13260 [Kitasatospora sp. NPDC097605]|uniref:hypothetical protein n=1 Tax=Kitasatospora sp. NPDC097605 TaxID=3157226 RepID=UPI003330F1FD